MTESRFRLLMFDNEFPPLGGGTGIVNQQFFRVWAERDDVAVDLVTSHGGRGVVEETFSEHIRIFRVPVGNINPHHARKRELIRYLFKGYRLGARLARRRSYDACFAFSGVPAGFQAYVLNRVRGLPYVLSLQGSDIPGHEARYRWIYPILKPLLRPVYRRAGFVAAISEAHRDAARAFMPEIDFPIVANGVDMQRFRPRQQPVDPASPVTLIHTGRLIELKGHHHLLRALAQARERFHFPVRMVFVGTGDREAALQSLCAQLGLDDVVEFTGVVDAAVMPDWYRQADVFVLPSQNEGMSLALLEALASGLPVVVTPVGGTRELVDEVNGRVVPWADVDALAEALVEWVNDPEARRRAAIHSREIAGRFSWEVAAQRYLSEARRLAGWQEPVA